MQTHTHATDDAGFSLVEVLVAFAVVSIITVAVVFTFNSSKAKAEVIIDFSNEVYNAVQRYEIDTGCIPRYLLALTSKAYASKSWSNSCNADVSARWNGPYLKNTRGIRESLGSGGWFYMYDGWGWQQRLIMMFRTRKSIAMQAKRLHPGGLQVLWCNSAGRNNCYIWITYR